MKRTVPCPLRDAVSLRVRPAPPARVSCPLFGVTGGAAHSADRRAGGGRGGARSARGRLLPLHRRRHGHDPVAASLRCRSVIRKQHLLWGGGSPTRLGVHTDAPPAFKFRHTPVSGDGADGTAKEKQSCRGHFKRAPLVPATPCHPRRPNGEHASVTRRPVAARLVDSTPLPPDRRGPLLHWWHGAPSSDPPTGSGPAWRSGRPAVTGLPEPHWSFLGPDHFSPRSRRRHVGMMSQGSRGPRAPRRAHCWQQIA